MFKRKHQNVCVSFDWLEVLKIRYQTLLIQHGLMANFLTELSRIFLEGDVSIRAYMYLEPMLFSEMNRYTVVKENIGTLTT